MLALGKVLGDDFSELVLFLDPIHPVRGMSNQECSRLRGIRLEVFQ